MRWLALAAIAALALGCGTSVETASTTSGGGATTTATTGTGGALVTSTTITVTTTTVTTAPPPDCDPATTYFDYVIDGGQVTHYGDGAPMAYFVWPGGASPPGPPPPPNATLVVLACAVCDAPTMTVSGTSPTWGPGVTVGATLDDYVGGVHYQSSPGAATLTLTTLSDVGGYLEGSFSGVLQPVGTKPPALQVSGKFRVCRRPDQIPV